MNVIRQTRHQVETLTWLRANLLICAEGRKALAEVSEALRDGESIRTSCATYVAESCLGSNIMIDIANRLIAAGLGDEVWKAGVFAATKGELLTPRENREETYELLNPAHALLEAIHACNDPAELSTLWDHVFDALFDGEESDDCGDDTDDLIFVADELIEAGNTDAVRAAREFALKKLDSKDPRSARYGQQAESTANELLKLLSSVSDGSSLMVFVDHVEERLQIAA